MHRAGEILAGISPHAAPGAPENDSGAPRGPGGLPLWVTDGTGHVGRVLEIRRNVVRVAFETWELVAGSRRYRELKIRERWIHLKRLRPAPAPAR